MNGRTLTILAIVAVIVGLLAVAGQNIDRGSGPDGALTGTALLPDLAGRLDALERVRVVTAGGVDAVSLRRDGDRWVVEQQDDYPADVALLREALVALAEATVVEEKTANPDFYSRLGVESVALDTAAGTAVRLEAEGDALPLVILGGESGSGRFARLDDAATSVLIDTNPEFATEAAQWLVPDLLDVRSERVSRVTITHADGETVSIAKASPDESTFAVLAIPEGRELQYASVANVTGNALRELRLEAARAATDTPDATVTSEYRTFDGLVVTIRGFAIDDEEWIGIEAGFEPATAADDEADAAAAVAAGDAESGPAGDTQNDGNEGDEAAAAEAPAADAARDEADAINARLAGWLFRVPSHIYSQMTRRMEDLLQAPPSTDTADSGE